MEPGDPASTQGGVDFRSEADRCTWATIGVPKFGDQSKPFSFRQLTSLGQQCIKISHGG